jgi:hypothetical protein
MTWYTKTDENKLDYTKPICANSKIVPEEFFHGNFYE